MSAHDTPTPRRKVIQVACQEPTANWNGIWVLCDDGTLWTMAKPGRWVAVAPPESEAA